MNVSAQVKTSSCTDWLCSCIHDCDEMHPRDSKAKEEKREMMSIKTNLLYDFAYMPGYDHFCPIPNIALEYYPKAGHFTYGASFEGPWWKNSKKHKYFQLRNYQIHTRYYLKEGNDNPNETKKGAAFKGIYLSAYAHAFLI